MNEEMFFEKLREYGFSSDTVGIWCKGSLYLTQRGGEVIISAAETELDVYGERDNPPDWEELHNYLLREWKIDKLYGEVVQSWPVAWKVACPVCQSVIHADSEGDVATCYKCSTRFAFEGEW